MADSPGAAVRCRKAHRCIAAPSTAGSGHGYGQNRTELAGIAVAF